MKLPVDEIDIALFAVATSVTINNGYTASFWKSSWLNGNASALLFPSLYIQPQPEEEQNYTIRTLDLQGERRERPFNYQEELMGNYVG